MTDLRYKRIAVKIGSNVLTRADGTLNITRMSALVDQVALLHREGAEVVLISSGAVASGRSTLRVDRRMDVVDQRQLFSAVGQAKLINHYYDLFREQGIVVGQVLTTKEENGVQVLTVQAKTKAGNKVSIPLDPTLLSGKSVVFSAEVEQETVSAPPKPWNGVKVMLSLVRTGYGIAVLPEATSIDPETVYVPLAGSSPLSYGVFYKNAGKNPLVRQFISIVLQEASEG